MLNKPQSELSVITKAKDLCRYITQITQKCLKHFRFTFVTRLQNLSLEIIEDLYHVIDSYHTGENKGLPLGNQTSQWFAILYLDHIDRLIKEDLHIKYYTRYMDDLVLLHHDKEYLRYCLEEIRWTLEYDLHLETNEKTKIFPISNGVNYLGFHFFLSNTGKVVRTLKQQMKKKYKKRLKQLQYEYSCGIVDYDYVRQVLNSYHAHLSHGDCWKLQEKVLRDTVFVKETEKNLTLL